MDHQVQTSSQIGDLLAAPNNYHSLPSIEIIAEKISPYLESLGKGSEKTLSYYFNVSVDSVKAWLDGKQIFTIRSLLKICRIMDILPSSFLMEKEVGTIKVNVRNDVGGKSKKTKGRQPFDKNDLKRAMDYHLASDRTPPLSMRKVAQIIGHDLSHLIQLFPVETKAISDRYRLYRSAIREERRVLVNTEVRNATIQVHLSGIYPSAKQVQKLLSKPCYIREAEDVWKQTLTELGY